MPRWTSEARAKQAALAHERKPWRHSTGPKKADGKARTRWNAYKHGLDSAPAIKLRRLFREHTRMLVMMVNISRRHCEEPSGDAAIHGLLRFARNDRFRRA